MKAGPCIHRKSGERQRKTPDVQQEYVSEKDNEILGEVQYKTAKLTDVTTIRRAWRFLTDDKACKRGYDRSVQTTKRLRRYRSKQISYNAVEST